MKPIQKGDKFYHNYYECGGTVAYIETDELGTMYGFLWDDGTENEWDDNSIKMDVEKGHLEWLE